MAMRQPTAMATCLSQEEEGQQMIPSHMTKSGCCFFRMVLNRAAVQKIMSPVMPRCPSPEYADDMFLGTLASQKQIYTMHSQMFRQVRTFGA